MTWGFVVGVPSRLPEHLVTPSAGGRLVLHAMYSVVDRFAFAVREDGRLLRSLSLSPDSGSGRLTSCHGPTRTKNRARFPFPCADPAPPL
ncbi:DUF6928 family protein [Streptomyces canus]|uniref:DUF6928 family protein n=1 Tax=Streptomyces canus TaxID=58343 RepID=UPI0038702ACD